uniref:Predicted protein n=1 Tax=Hordeum vulgare subsp. vulgare TaxID=112509 RepID=F2EKA4_HORVV|nr:predicted protein [Hordeum vulgare subsp. vulgare]
MTVDRAPFLPSLALRQRRRVHREASWRRQRMHPAVHAVEGVGEGLGAADDGGVVAARRGEERVPVAGDGGVGGQERAAGGAGGARGRLGRSHPAGSHAHRGRARGGGGGGCSVVVAGRAEQRARTEHPGQPVPEAAATPAATDAATTMIHR